MNLNEILKKTIAEKQPTTAKKYLYHVTFTKNVPNIKKKGLIQFQPSNWVKGPGGDRYNNDTAGIFAFDHPEDALNWAGKMEWEFRDTDKDISIVRIDMEDFWEDDPAEDPFVAIKGKARYSKQNISADKIIDVLDMSGIKRPGDLGISRDEWLADVSKKLTELHGGGGIPDYTTMPAYGLKRAKKGKHKFFVPKGEKLPAGVGAIKETFDQPYPLSWTGETDGYTPHGDMRAFAKLPDGTPLLIMFIHEGNGEYQVEFHRNHSQDVSGEGDAYKIFATVLHAIKKFIKERSPEMIFFSGEKGNTGVNPSRTNLYSRMVQKFARQLGYNAYVEDQGDMVQYELNKTDIKNEDNAWKVKVPKKSKRKMSKQDKDWSMLKTALESDLFEAGTGDCFAVANRAMIDMTEEQEMSGMKCVHAYVYGQGELKGRRFPHAWNEQGDVVFDNSNGNNIVMRKEQYYALGGIVQESGAYATYDKEDCLIKMLKHSHYGPWDLNDSLDENIPDEVKEIGKEKSRIPKNLLNTIKNELNLDAQVETAWKRFKSNVA